MAIKAGKGSYFDMTPIKRTASAFVHCFLPLSVDRKGLLNKFLMLDFGFEKDS